LKLWDVSAINYNGVANKYYKKVRYRSGKCGRY
jgi:hypothetical protein